MGRRVSVIPHWYTPRGPRLSKLEARRALGWPQNAKIFFTVRVWDRVTAWTWPFVRWGR